MKTQSLKFKTSTLIATIFLLATVREASAQVVINEFSSSDSSDWIELFNISSGEIDLGGWLLKDTAQSPINEFEGGKLPAGGYCVKEVSNRLNNDGDKIQLFNGSTEATCVAYGDGNGSFCGSAQDVGAPVSGQTAAREPNGTGSWVLGNSTKSTIACESLIPTPTPTPTNSPSPTLTPSPTPSKSPTPSPTKSPTPKPTSTPKKETESPTSEPDNSVASVLGTESTKTPEPTLSPKPQSSGNTLLLGVPLIAVGGGLLIGSSFVAYKKYKKDGIIKDDESKEI